MEKTYFIASLGGVFIGLAAVWLLLGLGRIAGVSGIFNGIIDKITLSKIDKPESWRLGFILGLIITGYTLPKILGQTAPQLPSLPWWQWIIAGLLVGAGSRIGSGCTSGHGVCGLGRRSKRSLLAVCTFMSAAMITVWIGRHV